MADETPITPWESPKLTDQQWARIVELLREEVRRQDAEGKEATPDP